MFCMDKEFFMDDPNSTYIYEFFSDMRLVVWIWIIGVHIFDGPKNAFRIQCVVVLPNVVSHHHVKKIPSNIVIWS